jgi:hypothetical protein
MSVAEATAEHARTLRAIVTSIKVGAVGLMLSWTAYPYTILAMTPAVIAALIALCKEIIDMKNLWRILCLAVFITGAVSFSQTPTKSKDWRDEIVPAVPYVMIVAHCRVNPDGAKTANKETIKYVSAKGEWRETRYDPPMPDSSSEQADTKKEAAVFAGTPEGVFAKAPGYSEKKSISQGPLPDDLMQGCFRSPICLKKQLSFVRMDEVAGLQVYVLRTEVADPAHPMEWMEQSYSPRTGVTPLRVVNHFRDGSEMRAEAVKVEFKDVPDNLNDDLKGLPVKK